MKKIFILMLLMVGHISHAEGYKAGEERQGGVVIGTAVQTYPRFEEDRNQVIETLRKMTDENASRQCAQLGFHKATRISDYKVKETFHGGFAYLSTIKFSAEYGCGEIDDSLRCYGPPSWYKDCQ